MAMNWPTADRRQLFHQNMKILLFTHSHAIWKLKDFLSIKLSYFAEYPSYSFPHNKSAWSPKKDIKNTIHIVLFKVTWIYMTYARERPKRKLITEKTVFCLGSQISFKLLHIQTWHVISTRTNWAYVLFIFLVAMCHPMISPTYNSKFS